MKQVLKSIVSNTLGALRAKTAAVQPLQQLSTTELRAVVGGTQAVDALPKGGW
ncbi:hypothetical protein [Ideonella oryzae]|uniref:Bacteriocin n=1 Tax=Ideonella oryzae TaxID=2937441 RepID=A0ABT1BR25_9BURK|nr:hypothetical protein [Ideonella oryzae]MCO5978638.1 hypothetical protein [Ideonella oryzae]